jgi:superfamily I DNA/RNA helicase
MPQLSDAQRRAVHTRGHAVVSACPGSGKTTVLAERAAHLLETHLRGNLVAVTFTNDAAEELAGRVRAAAPAHADRVRAGTFHKLAKEQLTRSGAKVRIANESQTADFVRRAIRSAGVEVAFEAARLAVQSLKITMSPERGDELGAVRAEYDRLLARAGLMDFQDLILEAVRGMEQGQIPPIDARFLLVDEFQDTDASQYAWVMAHVRAGAEVTIVGDDDQSIYGFRHALGYRGMRRFMEESHAAHLPLEMSYRCAPEILAAAARLIAHNSERVPKQLRTAHAGRGALALVYATDRDEEAALIATNIAESSEGGSWAVLTRTNQLLDGVEAALTAFGVRYARIDGRSFWDSPGPALFLSAADAIDRRDLHGIESVLSACGVDEELLAKLEEAPARARFTRFLDGIRATGPKASLVAELGQRTKEWLTLLEEGRTLLMLYGLGQFLEEQSPPSMQPGCHAHCARAIGRMAGTLRQRIAMVRNARSTSATKEGVQLMTLHSAKGLEFDRVWLAFCEEGVLPHKDGDRDEERRLMYVGMTRARHALTVSAAIGSKRSSPSAFLLEAGIAACPARAVA